MDKFSEIKKIYLEGYAKLDNINNRTIYYVTKLSKNFKTKPKRILDVGCGDGSFGLELGITFGVEEVYGIAISPTAVESAVEKEVKAYTLDMDEKDLPF